MKLMLFILWTISVNSQECGDEAAAINDVESCSFHTKNAVFGGLNLKNKPQTEETIDNEQATQPVVIPCAMAGTGNKKMDIVIKKLQTERSADDSATIFVGSGKELCQSGPMTEKTVETAEQLISILQDEHGIAKSNIDIATSTNNPTDPCICLIFWCNNDIEPCNMDIAAQFYDAWAYPVSESKLLGVTIPDFMALLTLIFEIALLIYLGLYAYFKLTYHNNETTNRLKTSQLTIDDDKQIQKTDSK